MEVEPKSPNPDVAADVSGDGHVRENGVEEMAFEYVAGGDGEKKQELPGNSKIDISPTSAQPTPKRRKLDKAEKEAERLRREEEKRIREQERLERLRIKEEEKRRKEEERLRREEEKRRKDEEKEQERLKREEEKRQRDEEKKRKEEEKEQERLKRDEEKRQRDEEKKRKDEEREQERMQKEEEKRKRDEEKRKKEEERLKRELEKKQAQEKIEEEKQKQANFMSKFLKITPTSRKSTSLNDSNATTSNSVNEGQDTGDESSVNKVPEVIDLENKTPKSTSGKNLLSRFNSSALCERKGDISFNPMPFQVKIDMALAPTVRKVLTPEERNRLDKTLTSVSIETEMSVGEKMDVETDTGPTDNGPYYLKEIKMKPAGKSEKTEVKRNNDTMNQEDEIEVLCNKSVNEAPVIDPPMMEYHFKLLQFTENRRPAYWGTWRTEPKRVTARRPFCREEDIDYDFDSDDEWEDEPEDGEDLKSEKESDDEESNTLINDEDDDEESWMVPHGYLSDDERVDAEIDGDKKIDNEDGEMKVSNKDAFKKQEEQYYKEIKLDKKLGLPYIQTDDLSAYRMILFTKKKERPIIKRNAAAPFYQKLKDAKEGRITGLYEGFPSSDEEDSDYKESDEDDEVSSDTDDNYASEDDLAEEVGVNKNKDKGVEVMDTS